MKRTPSSPPRRKPRQSRAHQTSLALQGAFIRLLVERGIGGITIREIVALAGASLGSFYEYFESKDHLARVCVHIRTKELLHQLQTASGRQVGRPLRETVNALVEAHTAPHRERPEEWGAHYLLERQFSGIEPYRKMYESFVDGWGAAISAASDPVPASLVPEAARVSLTVLYGLTAHAHVRGIGAPDLQALSFQARTAINAYLEAISPPHA